MTYIQRLLCNLIRLPSPGSPSMVVTRDHTGRRIEVDHDFYRAQRLAAHSTLLLNLSPFAWRIAWHLCNAPVTGPSMLDLFRARPLDDSILGWKQMGPPSVGQAPAGRYNRVGTSVLYLSTSEEGVRLEVRDGPLCIQRYNIDSSRLRIADFASAMASNPLQAAFDLAESACVLGRIGPQNYRFSQFLARRICSSGFDGFIVPGVRGNGTIRYKNVVLFHPEERWSSWSSGPLGFRRDP